MARVVLLTGGNTGDVKRTLQAAQQLINARVGAVLRCSHRYESKPWGFDAEQHFSNQALEVSTDLQPLEVLEAVQAIEQELGRNRAAEAVEKARTGVAYTSRSIDIDILFYDDEVIASERLTIPPASLRAGIRPGSAVRNHAPAPPPGHGADYGGDVRGPAPERKLKKREH